MNRIFNMVSENRLFAVFALFISWIIPSTGRLIKYKNILKVAYAVNRAKPLTSSNPVRVRIAPTSFCNYRCLFCEIHKYILLYPKQTKNTISIEHIKNYESFLSTSFTLSFFGGTGEPLSNNNFGDIVTYLKKRYGMKMFVNTNASLLNNNLADIFIRHGFDRILVSYHAGTEDGYKYLMTGNINKVDNNLLYLVQQKEIKHKKKPVVDFNFAPQKLNAEEYKAILNKAKSLNTGCVLVNRYHGSRNKIQDKQVSFDHDPAEGNKLLDAIYAYADINNIKLSPAKQQYWSKENIEIEWNPDNFNRKKRCFEPWMGLHFNPVLDANNCHLVGVCNRIELFKLYYDKINLNSQEQFRKLWNHPLLQYMRETVNSDNTNPICRYCKNPARSSIRNIDAQKYAGIRDTAIKNFFNKFRKSYDFEEIEGIEVLNENPNPDEKFQDQLKGMRPVSDIRT